MKPRPITLPNDTQAHDTIIEWWYFNGHLRDADGRQYAFMDCLFRADLKKVGIPYLKNIFGRSAAGNYATFAHALFADLAAKTIEKEVQNISLTSRDSFRRPLFSVGYLDPLSLAGGFFINEMAETIPGNFHIKNGNVDLTLRSRKRPLLEGGNGFISVRGKESFYYSLTRLETTGSVRRDDRWIPVAGISWMDHQWADTPYTKDRWTWFSLQMDDGTDIMCVAYDDGTAVDHLVDIIDRRGASFHGRNITLTPGRRTFKSKATKAEYPLTWTIEVPEYRLKLETSAAVPDGEMIFSGINYWEGPVTATGTIGTKKITGKGFMELAGYPSDYSFLMLTGKRLNKKLRDGLSSRIDGFFGKRS
jgi:predicted secreted hydrolase